MSLKNVLSLIRSISGHPCSKSYYHLALVVFHCCQLPIYSGFCLERQVYPMVSHETSLPVTTISRSVARAACDCWDHGDRQQLERIAGRKLIEKPSPKELISYLCIFLTGYPDLF